jgi:hypothetical protein
MRPSWYPAALALVGAGGSLLGGRLADSSRDLE